MVAGGSRGAPTRGWRVVHGAPPGPHKGGATQVDGLDRDLVSPPGHLVELSPILERLSRLERRNVAQPVLEAEGALGVEVAEVATPAPDVLLHRARVGVGAAEIDGLVACVLDPKLRPPGQRFPIVWVDVRKVPGDLELDRKSTRLNSSHANISY